jgi:hypothetical protein
LHEWDYVLQIDYNWMRRVKNELTNVKKQKDKINQTWLIESNFWLELLDEKVDKKYYYGNLSLRLMELKIEKITWQSE